MEKRQKNEPVPLVSMDETEKQMVHKIRKAFAKGSDAEVRQKKDGSISVYEISKRAIPS